MVDAHGYYSTQLWQDCLHRLFMKATLAISNLKLSTITVVIYPVELYDYSLVKKTNEYAE